MSLLSTSGGRGRARVIPFTRIRSPGTSPKLVVALNENDRTFAVLHKQVFSIMAEIVTVASKNGEALAGLCHGERPDGAH